MMLSLGNKTTGWVVYVYSGFAQESGFAKNSGFAQESGFAKKSGLAKDSGFETPSEFIIYSRNIKSIYTEFAKKDSEFIVTWRKR